MTKNAIDMILAAENGARHHEILLKAAAPASAMLARLEKNSGMMKLFEQLDRHKEAMRLALGPPEELRRAGMFDRISEATAQITRHHVPPRNIRRASSSPI